MPLSSSGNSLIAVHFTDYSLSVVMVESCDPLWHDWCDSHGRCGSSCHILCDSLAHRIGFITQEEVYKIVLWQCGCWTLILLSRESVTCWFARLLIIVFQTYVVVTASLLRYLYSTRDLSSVIESNSSLNVIFSEWLNLLRISVLCFLEVSVLHSYFLIVLGTYLLMYICICVYKLSFRRLYIWTPWGIWGKLHIFRYSTGGSTMIGR